MTYEADSGFIETAHGRKFLLNAPMFYIGEIAHALSQQTRFGGHGKRFYSVAEHSVLVANLCADLGLAEPLEGLLHDAAEAYIGDMPSPVKYQLPDFRRLEKQLESKFRQQYCLPPFMTDGCKRADLLALFIEAEFLMPSHGAWLHTHDPDNLRAVALDLAEAYQPECWIPERAELNFLARYRSLTR